MSDRMSDCQEECQNINAVDTSRWYVRNYVRIVRQGGDHSKEVVEISPHRCSQQSPNDEPLRQVAETFLLAVSVLKENPAKERNKALSTFRHLSIYLFIYLDVKLFTLFIYV